MRNYPLIAALACAATLSACGGGGDDAPPPLPATTNTSPTGTLGGSVTKGIIRNAVVVITQEQGSGTVVLGTGSTGSDGRYQIDYANYQQGEPILITVRSRNQTEIDANGGVPTTVVCDAADGGGDNACGPAPAGAPGDTNADGFFDLGEYFELGANANFSLVACIPGPPLNDLPVPVTPFTDLVVQRAAERDDSLGEDAQTALARAASEISQLIGGLDVLRLEPIDLSDPEAVANADANVLVYSALVAAILGNGVDAGGEVDLAAVIAGLRSEAGDGDMSLEEFNDLLAEAQEQLLGATGSATDDSGVLAEMEALADDCAARNADGDPNNDCVDGIDTVPAANAESNGVVRAKYLVANVRDTLNGLNDLEAPSNAFSAQVDMAELLVDPVAAEGVCTSIACNLFDDLGYILDQASLFVDAQTNLDTGAVANGSTTVDEADGNVNDAAVAQSATVTISGTGTKTMTITGTARDTVVNLTLLINDAPGRTTANPLTASLTGSTAETAGDGPGLRLTIGTGTATLTKTGNVALDDGNPETDESNRINSGTLALAVTLEQIRTLAENQGGTPPLTFTGTIGATVQRCTASSCTAREATLGATFNIAAIDIDGTFANSDHSLAMSLAGTMANASSFDPDLNDGTDNDTLTSSNFPQASITLQFDVELAGAPATRVLLTGSLNGIFVQPETCEGCSGTHADPNAVSTLTLLRDDPGDESTALVQVFRVQANTVDSGSTTDVNATITDSTGASITYASNDTAGDTVLGVVRVDGAQVGEVHRLSTGLVIVRYSDGTFESLF